MITKQTNLHLNKFLIPIPLKNKDLLLIHGLTGSVDIVSGKTKKYLEMLLANQKTTIKDLPDRFMLNKLIKSKYLISSVGEQKLYQQRLNDCLTNLKAGNKNIYITINPSERCNLACTYCINGANRNQTLKPVMDEIMVKSIFTILDFLRKKKGLSVTGSRIKLFGGEPFLPIHRKALQAIVEECQKRHFVLDITTNGTYLALYWDMIKNNYKIFNHFQITLDGPREVHNRRRITPNGIGYFDNIVGGINKLLKLKMHVTLRTNLDSTNFSYLPEIGKLIQKNKWHLNSNFSFSPHPVDNNYTLSPKICSTLTTRSEFLQKMTDIILKNPKALSFVKPVHYMAEPEELLLKAFSLKEELPPYFPAISGCATTSGRSYTFAADGNIYACYAAVGIKQFSIGTHYPKFSLDQEKILALTSRQTHKMHACQQCSLQFICGGGCALRAYYANKNMYKVESKWCDHLPKELETAANILTS